MWVAGLRASHLKEEGDNFEKRADHLENSRKIRNQEE